jgi:hypothetical protein
MYLYNILKSVVFFNLLLSKIKPTMLFLMLSSPFIGFPSVKRPVLDGY